MVLWTGHKYYYLSTNDEPGSEEFRKYPQTRKWQSKDSCLDSLSKFWILLTSIWPLLDGASDFQEQKEKWENNNRRNILKWSKKFRKRFRWSKILLWKAFTFSIKIWVSTVYQGPGTQKWTEKVLDLNKGPGNIKQTLSKKITINYYKSSNTKCSIQARERAPTLGGQSLKRFYLRNTSDTVQETGESDK